MASDPLTLAYSQFLDDGDVTSFLEAISQHGGRAPSDDVDYPHSHRICDVTLDSRGFRICRVYDVDDRSSRLFVFPSDYVSDHTGVPFWLTGDALHRWVVDEAESPAKAEIDWEQFRANA